MLKVMKAVHPMVFLLAVGLLLIMDSGAAQRVWAAPRLDAEPVRNVRRAASPPSPTCTNAKAQVRLQSADVARAAGLQFVRIDEQPFSAAITRNAESSYNENRYAHLSPRASGIILEVRKDLGDSVVAGEVLVVVDSAELGSAKADLVQAAATIELWKQLADRRRTLADRGIGAESEAQETENKLAESQLSHARASQRLRSLGLTNDDIVAVGRSRDTSSHLHVTAPFDGLVVERSAVLGEAVEPTSILFSVANTTTLWAMVDLFESDVMTVGVGQNVVFSPENVRGHLYSGKIAWISTHLDASTRTLKARAEVVNDDGLLRANTFGRARIAVRSGERALLIPKEAVQWDGCCNLVFLKSNDEGTIFQPKKVHLGVDTGTAYEALSGVTSGDVVVTLGSFLLKTEILKGSIGAGCCDHAVEKLSK